MITRQYPRPVTRTETSWGPWEPAALADVATLFSSVDVTWWVAGGYAIELAVGYSFREHSDVDVLLLRRDQRVVQQLLPAWEWWAADPPGTSGRGSPERSCPPRSTTSGAVPALRSPGRCRSCSMRRRDGTGFPDDVPRSGALSTSWAGTPRKAFPTWRQRSSSSTKPTNPGRRTKRTSGPHCRHSTPGSDNGWQLPSPGHTEIFPGATTFGESRDGTQQTLILHGIAVGALKNGSARSSVMLTAG